MATIKKKGIDIGALFEKSKTQKIDPRTKQAGANLTDQDVTEFIRKNDITLTSPEDFFLNNNNSEPELESKLELKPNLVLPDKSNKIIGDKHESITTSFEESFKENKNLDDLKIPDASQSAEVPTQIRHNTDTEPAQITFHISNKIDQSIEAIKGHQGNNQAEPTQSRHITDTTQKHQSGDPLRSDTIPTQIKHSADTIPTQVKEEHLSKNNNKDQEYRHNTGTIPTQSQHRSDTTISNSQPKNEVPTQNRHNNDTVPAVNTNTEKPTKFGPINASTNTIPTQRQHNTDTDQITEESIPIPEKEKNEIGIVKLSLDWTKKVIDSAIGNRRPENTSGDSEQQNLSQSQSHSQSSTIETSASKEPTQNRHNTDTSFISSKTNTEEVHTSGSQQEIASNSMDNIRGGSNSKDKIVTKQPEAIAKKVNLAEIEQAAITQARKGESKKELELSNSNSNLNLNSELNIHSEKKIIPRDNDAKTEPTQRRHSNDTIPAQNQHKGDTEATQYRHQSRHRTDTQSDTIPTQDLQEKIYSLTGLKFQLLDFLCQHCIANSSNKLPKISYQILAKMSGISEGSIRTISKRMKQEGMIEIEPLGKGPGALIDVVIPQHVINFFLSNFHFSPKVPTQYRHQSRHSTDTRTDTMAPSSSSSYIFNTKNNTTTTEIDSPPLAGREEESGDSDVSNASNNSFYDPEWESIQTPEVLKQLGFGKAFITQIRKKALCPARELQKQLDAFAYDVEVNGLTDSERRKKEGKRPIMNPQGFFFKCLAEGGYQPSINFKSVDDIAQEEMLQRKKERLAAIKQFEEELFNTEFELWLNTLSETEKRNMMPPNVPCNFMGDFHISHLKDCFREESWPEIVNGHREEVLRLTSFNGNIS